MQKARMRFYIVILILVGCIVWMDSYTPKDAVTKNDLLTEFNAISQMPGAKNPSQTSIMKNTGGVLSNKFDSSSSFDDLKKYYEGELPKHEWTFVEQKNLKDWGKYYGEKSLIYRKGKLKLSIEYSGERYSETGWTFAVSISW